MFDTSDFDLAPYADVAEDSVRRTHSSWDAGWRSMIVQRFTHAREVEHLPLPGTTDLHLVLCTAGDALMRTRGGDGTTRRRWTPGRLELLAPARPVVRGYRSSATLVTVQVHVPRATVDRTAAHLGGPAPDFDALAAAVAAGDPVVEHLLRSLPSVEAAGDLYAESAAAFLATHLLTRGRGERLPGPEHAAVRRGAAVLRERMAEQVTLAEAAAEAHLSVYHFVRVFRDATGETPYRYLTRLRIERARALLATTALPIARIAERCGFASPGALSAAFLREVGVRPSAYRKIRSTGPQSGAWPGPEAPS
ncbi:MULTISPECIES: AraC family transcriptional regulator [unclassified Nocardiopsis]|uniref:AraC family transcriptional regulator n=1 Tax=Nocardiopsis TaxID=2013 RepID=UPI00387AC971